MQQPSEEVAAWARANSFSDLIHKLVDGGFTTLEVLAILNEGVNIPKVSYFQSFNFILGI